MRIKFPPWIKHFFALGLLGGAVALGQAAEALETALTKAGDQVTFKAWLDSHQPGSRELVQGLLQLASTRSLAAAACRMAAEAIARSIFRLECSLLSMARRMVSARMRAQFAARSRRRRGRLRAGPGRRASPEVAAGEGLCSRALKVAGSWDSACCAWSSAMRAKTRPRLA